jgi:hypothetical protein
MPTRTTKAKAAQARQAGKAPATQAGAFVREEMEHVTQGRHGAKSRAQAIAIGLSKARRAGVKVPKRKRAKDRNRRPVPGTKSKKPPARRGATATRRATAAKSPARTLRARKSGSARRAGRT